jgi:hypothetical protein
MLTRRSKWFLALSAATPLLFAACTDNNIFNPQGNAVGTYTLTVYAGHSMPASFIIQPGDPDFPEAPNGGTFVVTGGQLVLNSDGSFSEINNFSITPSGGSSQQSSFISSGTWTLNGTSFTLNDQSRGRFVNGTLTEDTAGNIRVNYQETDGSGTIQSFEYVR